MSDKIEKINLESMRITEDQKRKLRQLFPESFNEDSIDWERLQKTLGKEIDSDQEKYGMTWPGKSDCFRIIQKPSVGTLKPCKEESIDFDKTQNLFIEGDNLEILKLLQKAYYSKIKMIYIDPPYNTGKEFIYPDKYSESLDTYLRYTGQKDEEGLKFSTNQETDGRFHSMWLNMIYPRLFLARNLLRDDGVIFISIDDNEQANLKKICDEIFGEHNSCGVFIWEKKKKPSFLKKTMGTVTEYIICYAKNYEAVDSFTSGLVEKGKKYPFNNAGNTFSRLIFPKGSVSFLCDDQTIQAQDMSKDNIRTTLVEDVEIKNGRNETELVLDGEWRYSQDSVDLFISNGDEIRISKIPFRPNYINQKEKSKKTVNLLSYRTNKIPTNEDATEELRDIFDADTMNYPKPTGLLKFLSKISVKKNDIVLDFFSGSATTAHAVMQLNVEDGWSCKYIMVQLPEPCNKKSEAYKKNLKTIADIGKERIRRVIKKIKCENEDIGHLDLGFKVFKLDKSNFKVWDKISSKAENIEKQLEMHLDSLISEDSSQEDILHEVLLKSGFELTTKIEVKILADKIVYSIEDDALLICLDKKLSKEIILEMAKLKPARAICLDIGFYNNDQLKTNAIETMRSHGVTDFKTV